MPKKKDGGVGRSAYVLVLREHEEQGSGYSLELAPLAASDAPQRARGGASSGAAKAEAEAEAAGTGSSAQGSRSTREDAAGGAPSRASTREAATTTGAAPRARGHSPARKEAATATATAAGRPPRPRGSQAPGLDTATDVAAGGPRGGEGEGRGRDVAEVGDDIAGEAGDRILNDMRRLLLSQPQDYFSQPHLVNTDDTSSKVREHDRHVLIPVFTSPKKNKVNQNKDNIWNKRQIMYGIALAGPLGFVPAVVKFLPEWALLIFAAVWGLSTIGFPCGLYGTYKWETGYSRHMGRLIFMVFCLFIIFMLYQYMSSPVHIYWTVGFAIVGGIVMAGHIASWVTGCVTGSDKDDQSESSGEEDMVTSDLLQRLLERH